MAARQPPRGTARVGKQGNVGASDSTSSRRRIGHPSPKQQLHAAVASSFSDPEEGGGLKWHPEEEFDPQVALEVINSRNALSGAGSDGLTL